MNDDNATGRDASTRRDYLKGSGAVVGGGLLAGCLGGGDSTDSTATNTNTAASTETATSTTTDGSYTVNMAPVGDVEFEDVPETWMAYFSTYGDMGIALGQLEGLQALVYRDSWPRQFYDTLPRVDVSFDDVEQLYDGGFDKEVFYELDSEVHLLDPNFVSLKHDAFAAEDFDEIAANVGPVVGTTFADTERTGTITGTTRCTRRSRR